MEQKIDLSGIWSFQLDPKKECPNPPFCDSMPLPGTTSYYRKGEQNETAEIGCLTDEYPFEGYAWFSREIEITGNLSEKNCFIFLERTRITTLWLDGKKIGTQNSLCAPHVYDVTGLLPKGKHTVTLCVDNTDYPTKGGHMTSKDSQTNWNGVTGRIELQIFSKVYLDEIQVYPDAANRTVTVKAELKGTKSGKLLISAESFNGTQTHRTVPREFFIDSGHMSINYPMGQDALLWSEYQPNLYRLSLTLTADGIKDSEQVVFGLRDFGTSHGKFTINGEETFLRGKHESMIFPLTGFAPTTLEAWLEKFKISIRYGMNHYRFHTCCPPDAAFTAADLLGVYLEPELPFWGTVLEKDDANAPRGEQEYLAAEGLRILNAFGNHPSFVMMSLGNELWGSKERLNGILKMYRNRDSRHLYTQGSNNFQFCPEVLENDDFFCGVRFSRDRLIRGSYAMCDAPLGHVQTGAPGTMKDYDNDIIPTRSTIQPHEKDKDGTIQIQYGTGTKTVDVSEQHDEFVPSVPVVSHEIGQYAVYPDFREIEKYKGPLKAKNFEVFRKRLEEKGLGDLAEKYFACSGKLAASCYREELEAAFRSKNLAGFQLLDLQDYSGQGTALVGMLDAFMESKGLISPDEWRSFCSDAVLLARFQKYIYVSGQEFSAHIQLRDYRPIPPRGLVLEWALKDGQTALSSGTLSISDTADHFFELGDINLKMPDTTAMRELTLTLAMKASNLEKRYSLWLLPKMIPADTNGINIFDRPSEQMFSLLDHGGNAILFAKPETLKNSIEGTYCTDFWCYPMFRSISENMHKPVPVGTMGLFIQNNHPVFHNFSCEEFSTEPWRSIVSASRALILDDTPQGLRPIVQVMDNFERNHKLGILFECQVKSGHLLVCTCDVPKISTTPEGKLFLAGILNYARSGQFQPATTLSASCIEKWFS